MAIIVKKSEIPGTVIEAKRWWRKTVRARLRELPADSLWDASAKIAAGVLALDEYKNAKTVFAYHSAGREVSTPPLIEQMLADGKRVCLPLCTDLDSDGKRFTDAPAMEARVITGLADLKPGAYNIPEPPADSPAADPSDIDLIILPCVTCDTSCRRLGQGGGYYDSFLARIRPDCARIAVCYEDVLADELPTEPHDMPVDAVVTEKTVYRWRG